MNRKMIATANIILNIQLNHWIFAAAAVSLLGILGMSESYLLLWITAGIVPVGMYFWRVKVKKILVFFVGLFASMAVGIVLPVNIIVKLIFIAMLLVYIIISIRQKLTETPEKLELLSPMVFVVLIGAMAMKNHIYTEQCLGLAWVYLVGYFLHYFMTVYLYFVEINENSASNIPEKELFIQGIKQVGVFSGIVIFFATLVSTEWISRLVDVLGEWMKKLLRHWLAGVGQAIEEDSAPQQMVTDAVQDNMFEAAEYSELWLMIQKIMERIFEVLVVLILALMVYYVVRTIIQFVKYNFTRVGKKKAIKTILSNQDIRESCFDESSKKVKKGFFDFLSNEQRIRACYKKKVLQEKVKIIGEAGTERLTYLTARECCEKMEDSDLRKVYEKVRYSKEKVTGEDVRRAKK